jgi:hypothetical protein
MDVNWNQAPESSRTGVDDEDEVDDEGGFMDRRELATRPEDGPFVSFGDDHDGSFLDGDRDTALRCPRPRSSERNGDGVPVRVRSLRR